MTTTTDLGFARRSVTYLLKNGYRAEQIVSVLTNELGITVDAAHRLVSETTTLVPA
jgi:hypothetical protein